MPLADTECPEVECCDLPLFDYIAGQSPEPAVCPFWWDCAEAKWDQPPPCQPWDNNEGCPVT